MSAELLVKAATSRRADDVARAQQLGEWLGGVALAAGRWLALRREPVARRRARLTPRVSHAQQALPQCGRSGQLV